jgi:segregation and condensation protein B
LPPTRPPATDDLRSLFGEDDPPGKDDLRAAIAALEADYANRGIAVQEVASGYRIQVRSTMAGWLGRLWEERAPRYSRALLETLAIIAYRQPVTRGDVEEIRGVGVTTNIMRTLLERNWIRVVGFRDVPGKPAMYGTTREFLDYFGLKKLDDLPALADLRDLDALSTQLDLAGPVPGAAADGAVPGAVAPDAAVGARGDADAEAVVVDDGADDPVDDFPRPTADNVIPLKVR